METLNIASIRRAIESRDGASLAGFYRDDAVMHIIDQNNPPGAPHDQGSRCHRRLL
jgi:hypothetical protein